MSPGVLRRRAAAATRPCAFTRRQGLEEHLACREHVLVRHLGALRHGASQLPQRAPDETLAHLRRALCQCSLLLAIGKDFADQRSCLASSRLVSKVLRVPVHEGEAEHPRLRSHRLRQCPPEDAEGGAEALRSLAVRPQVFHLGVQAQLLLGEAAHLQGEVPLVAVLPVHRAHRDARGLRQLPGLHLLVAPPRQHVRRVPHGGAVHMPRNPFHPRKPPRPSKRLTRGSKVPSALVLLPTGWV
jgi:hypothetical protein